MLESVLACILVGTVLGFLAGLGTGGGSLLILWLTAVLGTAQETARAINLLFFLPAAVIACCFRWKQGYVNFGKLWPAIVFGCLSAAGGSWLASHIPTEAIKKLFGILLLFTGLRELLYKPRHTSSKET